MNKWIFCLTLLMSACPANLTTVVSFVPDSASALFSFSLSKRKITKSNICRERPFCTSFACVVTSQISSVSNPLVKRLVRIRENPSFRMQEGSVLLVGSSPIQEVLQCLSESENHRALKTLLLLEDDGDEWHEEFMRTISRSLLEEAQIYKVSGPVMKKISGLETSEHRIAVAEVALPRAVSKAALQTQLRPHPPRPSCDPLMFEQGHVGNESHVLVLDR